MSSQRTRLSKGAGQGRVRLIGVREKTAIPFWFPVGCVVSTFGNPLSFRAALRRHTGPSAVLSHRDHVRVVRGDFLNDAGEAGTTAMLNVPDKNFHCFLQVCCRR